MRRTLPIFGANSRILSWEDTTELVKLLSLLTLYDENCINIFSLHCQLHFFSILKFCCKKFILPEDRILALSPVGKRYAKLKKKQKRYVS